MAFHPLKSAVLGAVGENPAPVPVCVPGLSQSFCSALFPSAAEWLHFPFCIRECCSSVIVVFILQVVLGMLCGTLLAALAYDLQEL